MPGTQCTPRSELPFPSFARNPPSFAKNHPLQKPPCKKPPSVLHPFVQGWTSDSRESVTIIRDAVVTPSDDWPRYKGSLGQLNGQL